MKLSKKFFDDLDKIGQDAFIEKNMWIGKLVPEIIVDNLKKRGITPDDFEGGCFQNGNDHLVCLTVDEAKEIYDVLDNCLEGCIHEYEIRNEYDPERLIRSRFKERIAKAEMSKQST